MARLLIAFNRHLLCMHIQMTARIAMTLISERAILAGIILDPVHSIVGTWIVNDLGPEGSPSLTSFTSDGVVIDIEAEGGDGLGVWQPTGERTAAFTMV